MRMDAYIRPVPFATAAQKSSLQRLPRVELYRLVADPDRLRLLALCATEELSVGELAELLDESQPQVSRKVQPLRQAGLLEARREGTRTLLCTAAPGESDPVLADALEEGRRLCHKDGSLARIPALVAAREERGRELFEAAPAPISTEPTPYAGFLAHLSALSFLLPSHALAVDVGTGEGLLLDVLAPLYDRVLAVDRSSAQLARCAKRIAERGFTNVSLFPGSYEDVSLLERVEREGGADLVFAARTLHHASRPKEAVKSCARLLKKGGLLLVLDYLPHEEERMRSEQGDVWLGLPPQELEAHAIDAGLQPAGFRTLPPALHRDGPDKELVWYALAAQKPFQPSLPRRAGGATVVAT